MSEMSSALRPELGFIQCAVGGPTAEWPDAPRRLAADVEDWSWILDQSTRHSVVPLVARAVAAAGEIVPANVRSTLEGARTQIAVNNLSRLGELLRIHRQLGAAAIEAMPIKGPILGALAYGDVGLRQFSDLDILVRRRDVERAIAVLSTLGFVPVESLAGGRRGALLAFDYHLAMVRDPGTPAVEIHWGFNKPMFGFRYHEAWWWERTQSVPLGDGVRTFDSAASLLYLAIHGGKHGWYQLRWIADVAGLLRGASAIDWVATIRAAREMGSARMLRLALALASQLAAAPVPEEIRREVARDPAIARLSASVRARLFDSKVAEPSVAENLRFYATLHERARDRVRWRVGMALTPTHRDREAVALPSGWHALYYALKPVRVLRERAHRALDPDRTRRTAAGT